MSAVLAAATLARSGEGSKAGPIGLAVILLLCIACYFLFKSMSGHMRRVRENFPADPPPATRATQPSRPGDPPAPPAITGEHRPPAADPGETPGAGPDQTPE